MTSLPLVAKVFIGIALIANFVVITQWERFPFGHPPAIAHPPLSAIAEPAHPDFPRANETTGKDIDAPTSNESIVRRMRPITIDDPKVQTDGSIEYGDRRLLLYGIKPFNSRAVCTRTSGEKWACGLHAYATLRNALAHNTIVCQPEKMSDQGLEATCRLAGLDVALVLVRNGLVEVTEDAPNALLGAQATARKEKAGIWDR